MKRTIPWVFALVGLVVGSLPASTQVAPPTGKSLAATMSVYVFPGQGQSAEQQSKDESECYNWAVQNTGTDPFDLAKQTEQQKAQAQASAEQTKQATKGAGAGGAVKGAAAGALIGEIASDDAGEGAAIGAAAGLVAGRRRAAGARQQADAQAQQQTQQADATSKEKMDAFRKAFSACLEAKSYTVKF